MQKDVYPCFIHYTKAFDKVRHKDLLQLFSYLDIFGKDIRIIKNIYWQQTACIQTENKSSRYTKIEKVVRQGRVFSPDLFNLYNEAILRELELLPGFIISGHNLNNIRYANYTVLMEDTEKKTTKTPTKCSEGKQEEKTKHQLREVGIPGFKQKEEPNFRVSNRKYQNQTNAEI